MPQLARLRYIRVGHREARADDLVLPFTTDGHPTDSTLWLRNGGGKSSLLALFFSLLVPGRRQFLGARSESGERALGDYVRPQETGIVVAEWVLDMTGGDLGLFAGPRLITGTVLEWSETRGQEYRELLRAFFSWRTLDGVPATTMEGLPVVQVGGTRTTLRGLKQFCNELRTLAPAAEGFWTERQGEWTEHLESLGLDPRLFEAQATMNQGEGEAERLFSQFRVDADYIRFFLELLAPPDQAEPIVRNLTTHRDLLRVRRTQLLPEQALVAGLQERFKPLVAVQVERGLRTDAIGRALGDGQALDRALEDRHAKASEEVTEAEREITAQTAELSQAREAAEAAQREGAWAALWLASQALAAAVREREQVEMDREAASRDLQTWTAGITLRTIRRHEDTIARLRIQLAERETAHRPLKAAVEATALRLAEALEARRQQAEADMTQAEQDRATAEAEDHTAREAEREGQQAGAGARHAVDEARRRRQQAQQELETLRKKGDLAPDEEVADALTRHLATVTEAASEVVTCERDAAAFETQKAGARRLAQEARVAAEQARVDLARLEQSMGGATGEASRLARNTALARFLELDEMAVDVRTLDAGAVSRLRRVAREALERVLAGHVHLSVDRRALEHLETHGVLPPSPVVDRLLRALNLPQAWDGWRYLAETLPLDAARDVVRRAPAIATGIVVRDVDLEAAIQALTPLASDLDDPVLIMPASRVVSEGLAAGIVIGATDDAHLDKAAGEATRQRRDERFRVAERAQEETDATRAEAEALAAALADWQQRFPPSWWREIEERTAALGSTHSTQRDEATRQDEALAAAERGLVTVATRRDAARRRAATARTAVEHLSGWRERHPDGLEGYQRQEKAAEAANQRAQVAIAQARDRQRAAQEARNSAERRRSEYQLTLSSSRRDLGQIRYLSAVTVVPLAGDTVSLARAHDDAIRHYEQTVGIEAITHQIDQARREVATHRETLTRQCRDVPEPEVARALDALPDPGQVENLAAEAEERGKSLFSRLGNVAKQESRAQDAKRVAEEAWAAAGGLELTAPPIPADEAEAQATVRTARAAEQQARGRQQESEGYLATAQEYATKARSKADRANDARERLAPTLEQLRTLVRVLGRAVPPGASDLAETLAADDQALRTRLGELSRLATKEDAALRELDRQRDRHHQAIQTWCDEPAYAELSASVATGLRRFSATQMEAQAAELLEALALRAQTIAQDLAATDRDRDLLIRQALGIAREGAQLLSRLARYSLIPETVPTLGGKTLLQCRLNTPELEAEGRERIGAILDEYVTAESLPGPARFFQEAVLRLAGPITLRILRPSLETSASYEPITTLGKFSGGEKLTVATLLYCALANTRARSVGRRSEPTGVLLMDNPFGKASRAGFITLQREVAARLGIQLIYLTGINDYEALRCFPNVVRLENARYDRRTGERIVELADSAETDALLTAVRIARREQAPSQGNGAQ